MSRNSKTVVPRNGHTLVTGIVARISGCPNQKELSLKDQVDHGKQVVAELYEGPDEYRVVATKGKGERLDRPELAEVEAMIRSRELDLLICEDLGRLVRGTEAAWLCGIAADYGTRVIAVNDCIDTADGEWEADVIAACRDHVGHNAHTSKRIKQKLMNRFMKFGGAPARPICGYIVPPGSKTYADWTKDPEATEIYQEWFRRLLENPNCSALADWLNQRGIRPGKYARRKTWDGKMVRRVTANRLLIGKPGRGFRHTIKYHETGRRVAVKNPNGPVFVEFPHLAHVDPHLWDEVNRLLEEQNKGFGRKPVNGIDPRLRVPKKRTRFPGQHARCWYCGRMYTWGGNGVNENLMCSGSREWRCWNSIGFSGSAAATAVTAALRLELERLEGFDAQFREMIEEANRRGGSDMTRRVAELDTSMVLIETRKTNFRKAIERYGPKPMFDQELAEIEAEENRINRERWEVERLHIRPLNLPRSVVELRELFENKCQSLASESPEFGRLLQQVVPEFHVYLVRLCDGGHMLPRARATLSLAGVIPDAMHAPTVKTLLNRVVTLDLFEPPQRERIRVEAVRLESAGLEQREIACRLPEAATQAAVYQALALDRKMRSLGLDTPYVLVGEPPGDYAKLRRHRNPRYAFEPLAGYQPPEL